LGEPRDAGQYLVRGLGPDERLRVIIAGVQEFLDGTLKIEWRLRGKPGSNITVTVRTAGSEPRTVTFTRFDAENPSPSPTTSRSSSGNSAPAAGSPKVSAPAGK
jgi:hypothetical protein